jgi:hypothetical protein
MSGLDARPTQSHDAVAHRAVLDAYFEGINGEHYEDVAALFAPDAELFAPGFPVQRGRAEIAAYFPRVLAPYPVHDDEPTRFAIADDTAVVHIHFEGALASGEPLTFDAVDVFDFAAYGTIAALGTWYDSHAVLGRLTAALAADGPEPGVTELLGSLAAATAARAKAALGTVREGESLALGGAWRGVPADAPAIAARAVVADLAPSLTDAGGAAVTIEAAAIEGAVAATGAKLRPGDFLLLRTAGAAVTLGSVPDALAAIAVDGTLTAAPAGLTAGEGWGLDEACARCRARGRWTGLLTAAPGAAGEGSAVLLL